MKIFLSIFISLVIGFLVGCLFTVVILSKDIYLKQNKANKFFALYMLMYQWVQIKQNHLCIENFFLEKGYRCIAIYGMNFVGQSLFKELIDSNVNVKYAIDQRADGLSAEIPIVFPDYNFPEVDVIVVTPIIEFGSIEKRLMKKINCPIVSIEEVIMSINK